MDPVLSEANQRIQQVLEHLKKGLAVLRANRANPALIEEIPVLSYGTRVKLLEVGTISAPSFDLLLIQVWDPNLVESVVKSIQEANLGLNPSVDGQTIRLSLPPLTSERREEFLKVVGVRMEEARVEIRQVRHHLREAWEDSFKKGEFGKDEKERRQKLLQELVDWADEQVEVLGEAKKVELLKI